ncbi:MAG TPA: DNA-binding response regulator, partial [Sutterella sp.]|nr:DNA-binding response regulator [Sutterella sp.]
MSARHFLIVDDHALIVQGLSFLLKTQFPESVVHTGTTADQARNLAELYGSATDLMILDLSLPDVKNPTDLLEELVRSNPTLKILVLSGITDPEQVTHVLKLGAAGFVPKSLETETLTSAVNLVLKGGVYVPMKLLTVAQKKRFIDSASLKASSPDVRLTD